MNALKKSKAYKDLHKRPCRIIVVQKLYHPILSNVVNNLSKDGFVSDLVTSDGDISLLDGAVVRQPNTLVGKALHVVSCVMKKVQHCIHRGGVYSKNVGGKLSIHANCSNW